MCRVLNYSNAIYYLNKKDGFMLNPGLSALWSEEEARRKLLNIKKPLENPDLDGKFCKILIVLLIEF
jgi:hypothetical protein